MPSRISESDSSYWSYISTHTLVLNEALCAPHDIDTFMSTNHDGLATFMIIVSSSQCSHQVLYLVNNIMEKNKS